MKRDELIKEVRKNFAHINAEYIGIDYESINTLKKYRSGFIKLTGTKGKKAGVATGNLSRMNKKQLNIILNYQKKFFANPYTSKEKREKIFKQAQESTKKKYDMTSDQYTSMLELFSDVLATKFSKFVPSEMIVETAKKGGKSDDLKLIFNIFNEYSFDTKNDFDFNANKLQSLINKHEEVIENYNSMEEKDFKKYIESL